MRTTLDIEDSLLIKAKTEAAKSGRTLTSIVEDALRTLFGRKAGGRRKPYKFNPTIIRDTAPPAVDIADRRALYDFLDKNP